MLKKLAGPVLCAALLGWLASPAATVVAQNDNNSIKLQMPIQVNQLTNYDIEISASQPFRASLTSPASIQTARKAMSAGIGARTNNGVTTYTGTISLNLSQTEGLTGLWQLQTTFARDNFPEDYTVKIKTTFTR